MELFEVIFSSGTAGLVLGYLGKYILDIISKRIDHKIELKRFYFGRQLNSAESVTSSALRISGAATAISSLIDSLKDGNVDGEYFDTLYLDQSDKMADAEELLFKSNIELYFDVGDEGYFNKEKTKKTIDAFARIKTSADWFRENNDQIDEMRDQMNSVHSNPDFPAEAVEEYVDELRSIIAQLENQNENEVIPELSSHLTNAGQLLDQLRDDYEKIINKIKEQIKKEI